MIARAEQVFRWSPEQGELGPWINATGRPGRVLLVPSGEHRITEPVFISGFDLVGDDPHVPPTLHLERHGMLWAGQRRFGVPSNRAYVVNGALCTRPAGLPPASFDVTETGICRQGWNRVRKMTIELELETPEEEVEPGGLFSGGPFWAWWHPNAPKGPELKITTGKSAFDPADTRHHVLTWDRPAKAPRLRLVWTIDLDLGEVRLSCNGVDLGGRFVGLGRVFPAVLNRRGCLGEAQIERSEHEHRWAEPRGAPPLRRIRKFEAVNLTGGLSRRLWALVAQNPWDFGIHAPEGSGPLLPVPWGKVDYGWTDGKTGLKNFRISSDNRFRSGVRVGAVMGECRFEDLSFSGVGSVFRKLAGTISYTHYFDRIEAANVDGFMLMDHAIVHGYDWRVVYPRFFGVSMADSNFTLERFTATSATRDIENSELQHAFHFVAWNNGGAVSIRDGLWNDEEGKVALGAWLYFRSGSKDTSPGRLIVENTAINCPGGGVPTYWLDAPPNVPGWLRPQARILGTHWHGPNVRAAEAWQVALGPEAIQPTAP